MTDPITDQIVKKLYLTDEDREIFRKNQERMDADLEDDPLAVVGRFLWWAENAKLDDLSSEALHGLRRAVGYLGDVETELEGSDD